MSVKSIKTIRQKLIVMIGIGVISLLWVLPGFLGESGIPAVMNQDTIFHLSRINGLGDIWKSPVSFENFNNTGTIVNQFYPWLLIYPAYLLSKYVGLVGSYWTYIWFITFVTAVSSYWAFKQLNRNVNNTYALLFSALYTGSAYRSVDVFNRGALGETITFIFLPLVFVGFINILFRDSKRWWMLTLGMTGIVYSHVVTTFIVSFLMGIVIVVSLFSLDDKSDRLLSFLKATILTLITTAFVYIPELEQLLHQSIYTPRALPLEGVNPIKEVIASLGNLITKYYTLGIFSVVSIVISLIVFPRLQKMDRNIFVFGIVLWIITSSLFPWQILNETVLGKVVGHIQFLFRFNAIITLLFSYIGVKAIMVIVNRKNLNIKYVLLVSCMLVIAVNFFSVKQLYQSTEYNLVTNGNAASLVNKVDRYKDYRSLASISSMEDINNHHVYVEGKKVNASIIYQGSKAFIKILDVEAGDKVDIPFFKYKGIRITNQGVTLHPSLSDRGTTLITAPESGNEILVEYNYTTGAKLAALISILGGLWILHFKIIISKWRNEQSL
ncbi:hypothetical protein EFM35_08210 [Weissella cibaria]|nr:hypothetical protein [Weissella cibaria]